jgi:hypothetical protein
MSTLSNNKVRATIESDVLNLATNCPVLRTLVQVVAKAFPCQYNIQIERAEHASHIYLRHLDRETNPPAVLEELRFVNSHLDRTAGEKLRRLEFSDNNILDSAFRDLTILHQFPNDLPQLPLSESDVVLCSCEGAPVWTLSRSHATLIHYLALPVPVLSAGSAALDYFTNRNFLSLLPVLNLLKTLALSKGWVYPAPTAAFMFDDPNIHWNTYGFINFGEIAKRAQKHHYHASFAMVPLDTWFSHRGTVELFRDNCEQISLLIHGNNHIRCELARRRTATENLQLIAQAVRRIRKFEMRTGIPVDRIMAAPHGACNNAVMSSMHSLGVEGAFISPWSLRLWEEGREWIPEFGLRPAELVGNFAIAPRFAMAETCDADIAIAAFLGKPIIPVGHHTNLRKGPELLDVIAAKINRLKGISWLSPVKILRRNYLRRSSSSSNTIEIVPFSSQIEVSYEHAKLMFHFPRRSITNSANNAESSEDRQNIPTFAPVTDESREWTRWKLSTLGELDHRTASDPGLAITALLRRIACEARDRLAPLLPNFHGF